MPSLFIYALDKKNCMLIRTLSWCRLHFAFAEVNSKLVMLLEHCKNPTIINNIDGSKKLTRYPDQD